MLLEVESPYDTKTTVEKIKQSVKNVPGWGLAKGAEVSFSDVLNKNWTGQQVDSIYVVEICNPDYSGAILSDDETKFAATMMPCIIAAYQKDNGKTYVAYMNVRMMATVFSGFIQMEVTMGEKIAADQDKMLDFLPLPKNTDWGDALPGLDKSQMVLEQSSVYNTVDETVEKLRENVETVEGWEFFLKRETEHLDEVIKTKRPGQYDDLKSVCLIEICNKSYSRRILIEPESRFVSVLLPCTIAVYEKNDGSVWIARMNTSRLGQVWGSTIEDVMTRLVSPDVARIIVTN